MKQSLNFVFLFLFALTCLCVHTAWGQPSGFPFTVEQFTEPSISSMYHVTTGDFDNNGCLDLAFLGFNWLPKVTVFLRLNKGDGTFHPSTVLYFGDPVAHFGPLRAADLNNDGNLDIVNEGFDNGRVFLGDGKGVFSHVHTYTLSNEGNWAEFVLEDLNGDEFCDILTGVMGGTVIFWGQGDGTFSNPPFQLASGFPMGGFHNLVGDFNNDGKKDIVTGSPDQNGSTLVFLGDGAGGFDLGWTIESYSWHMAAADFNLDGNLDLAGSRLYHSYENVEIFLGDGTGALPFATSFDTSTSGANRIVAGDFFRDGIPDLLVGIGDNFSIWTFFGNGDGTFSSGYNGDTAITRGNVPSTGDIDKDGNLDVLFTGSLQVGILRNSSPLKVLGPCQVGSNFAVSLDFPDEPHRFFALGVSGGTQPGFTFQDKLIPLHPNSLIFLGFLRLDGFGHGSMMLNIPDNPSLAGITAYLGGITFSGISPNYLPSTVSNNGILTVLP